MKFLGEEESPTIQETGLHKGIVIWKVKGSGGENRRRTRVYADLDGGVDGVANDAGVRLPGAEPHGGDLGAGVEHEVPRHRRPSLPLGALCHTAEAPEMGERRGGGRSRTVVARRGRGGQWCLSAIYRAARARSARPAGRGAGRGGRREPVASLVRGASFRLGWSLVRVRQVACRGFCFLAVKTTDHEQHCRVLTQHAC